MSFHTLTFHQTLTKLHEHELDKVNDKEELLVHLPSWSTAEENPDVDVAGMKGDSDRDDVDESTKTQKILYNYI